MVCKKCEKKLGTVICPDVWKDGARNGAAGSTGRKVNENKILSSKSRYTPYVTKKCKMCKSALHQPGAYCQTCAYKKGICAMCGKQILENVTMYKQSAK